MAKLLLISLLVASGCTGPISPRLAIEGRSQSEGMHSFDKDGWSIEPQQAVMAIGPIYLCPSAQANNELCATGQAELLTTHIIDLLSTEVTGLGDWQALRGEGRSWMFDYGISWWPTQTNPRPTTPVASTNLDLSGQSVRFVFRAKKPGQEILVTLQSALAPAYRGSTYVASSIERVPIDVNTQSLDLIIAPQQLLESAPLAELNSVSTPTYEPAEDSALRKSVEQALGAAAYLKLKPSI